MMETGNLNIMQYLTAGREGGEVEFKQTTGQLERGMETLCAFLNGAGGTVLFGVKDNGKIIGQEETGHCGGHPSYRTVCHDNGFIRRHSRHGQTSHRVKCGGTTLYASVHV